ncbi:FliI/YscN family ATPase [Quadrisphaera sp. DSM 44207]|uniref:FliI/YscN family ATPase n=1 Tax=Quadrisphaera sp. DSM 44207 TaxID=1881057 RepID=UPI000880FAE9|nr:FliI/YscN family ATPase [Quadrisphaera sp. DSM 44207]SDQ20070.1 flagellum-specific ATP synthase [Quadrisphaera sp. DSM 44207]
MSPATGAALDAVLARAAAAAAPEVSGTVSSVLGLSVEVAGLPAAVGDLLRVVDDAAGPAAGGAGDTGGGAATDAEVVAVSRGSVHCMPLGRATGLRAGQRVLALGRSLRAPVGAGLLGRVLDGLGRPLDGRGPLVPDGWRPVDAAPPNALERQRVAVPLGLGVRALDTLVPAGRGQRFGLFAGSGVGKSTLLSMIARGTSADVSVIALIGERGREVREFLEDDLGPEGLARSVVVVATSDEPPLVRLRAAMVATTIAEAFRDAGRDAVLMMDSLTRFATAQREIGLSVGEPPATRGYPPSVFALLPRLLERAGTGPTGSITGIYTVLVDGDDHDEPIADAARSILDGHVVLDRRLATAGHFPSIDVLGSVSRVASRVTTREQRADAAHVRRLLAARRDAQDLVDVGAYARGSNPVVDAALAAGPAIDAFLRQDVEDVVAPATAWARLRAIAAASPVAGSVA